MTDEERTFHAYKKLATRQSPTPLPFAGAIRFKKLRRDAVTPTKAHPTDAGFDLTAVTRTLGPEGRYIEYGIGIAVEVPDGFVGLLFPRSSISNTCLRLANGVGVLDASYRGEIKMRFKTVIIDPPYEISYGPGDRIGQLVIVPIFAGEMIEVEELSDTERGTGGFGSSGD